MALTKQEIDKVNDLFRQIDEKDSLIKQQVGELEKKSLLLKKAQVTINERQKTIQELQRKLENSDDKISQSREIKKSLDDILSYVKKLTGDEYRFITTKEENTSEENK